MKNYFIYDTSIGKVAVAQAGGALTHITPAPGFNAKGFLLKETPLTKKAACQLKDYFTGKLKKFDLPLEPQGTDFQKSVWKALTKIPYGQTRSYKDIAAAVGNPKAVRAVGGANNRNPIFIVIPCHRVIGADGALVGYASGLEVKKKLLYLEGALK